MWKCIHAFANLLISYFCINDLLKTAVDPIGATKGVRGVDYSMKPAYMILCLHIYHLLPFMRFKLHDGDVFHHLVFVGIVGPVGIAFDTGPLQNFVAFFICGLPGALDYIMLVLVKLKMLSAPSAQQCYIQIRVGIARSFGNFFSVKKISQKFFTYANLLHCKAELPQMCEDQ